MQDGRGPLPLLLVLLQSSLYPMRHTNLEKASYHFCMLLMLDAVVDCCALFSPPPAVHPTSSSFTVPNFIDSFPSSTTTEGISNTGGFTLPPSDYGWDDRFVDTLSPTPV